MNISEILEQMEDMMEDASRVPLMSGKRFIDSNQMQQLIDDIRANLPEEIRQAQATVEKRAQILEAAKQEGQKLIDEAKLKADEMVSAHEITKQAQEKANDIMNRAAASAKEMQQQAVDFSDSKLIAAEKALQTAAQALADNAGQIQNSRATLLQK